MVIIFDKERGITDKYTLNRAASLHPRILFVVELESYDKLDQFVDVYSDVPLLLHSLQIVCATWCINFQGHCPNPDPKFVFPWNINVIWSFDDQERGIGETQPERRIR